MPVFLTNYRAKHPVKVHVWAGISMRGATGICIFEGTMDKELFAEFWTRPLFPTCTTLRHTGSCRSSCRVAGFQSYRKLVAWTQGTWSEAENEERTSGGYQDYGRLPSRNVPSTSDTYAKWFREPLNLVETQLDIDLLRLHIFYYV